MCLYICVRSHAVMLLEPSCFVLLSGQASRQDDWCSRPFGKGQIKPNANTHAVSAWPGPEDPCSSPPASPARATPAFGNTDTGQSACMPARLGGLMVQPHVGVPAPLLCPAGLPCTKAARNESKKKKKILQWKTIGSHFRQQFDSKHGMSRGQIQYPTDRTQAQDTGGSSQQTTQSNSTQHSTALSDSLARGDNGSRSKCFFNRFRPYLILVFKNG